MHSKKDTAEPAMSFFFNLTLKGYKIDIRYVLVDKTTNLWEQDHKILTFNIVHVSLYNINMVLSKTSNTLQYITLK